MRNPRQNYIGLPEDVRAAIECHRERLEERAGVLISFSAAAVSLLKIGIKEALRVRKGRAA